METIFTEGSNGRHSYYWNYAIYQGRLLIDGWYPLEQEATQFGYKNIPVAFETIPLNTKDRNRATQVIKRRVWEQTGDIDQALRRAKHPRNNDALQ